MPFILELLVFIVCSIYVMYIATAFIYYGTEKYGSWISYSELDKAIVMIKRIPIAPYIVLRNVCVFMYTIVNDLYTDLRKKENDGTEV